MVRPGCMRGRDRSRDVIVFSHSGEVHLLTEDLFAALVGSAVAIFQVD